MTEENIDNSGATQDQAPSTHNVEAQSVSTPTNNSADVISKARANDLIHQRTKEAAQKAYERGLQEAETKRQNMGMGGMPQMSDEQLRSMVQDEFKKLNAQQQEQYSRQAAQAQIHNLANEFMGKIAASKDKYPDLEKRHEEIAALAPLVPYINETDEAAGITQHLIDNGNNVASLLVLSQVSPLFLRREVQRLAASIKNNEAARNYPEVNEPLSQPTPSNTTMDSGSGSIEALKQQPWLRG